MLHFVVVGILVLVVSALTYFGLDAAHLLPIPASAQAGEIDWMWNLQLIAMSFLFSLIVVPMFYSLIVFRRKKGDTTDAQHIEGNTRLELAWSAIPLFVVVFFAYLGAGNLADTIRPSQNAMVVKVRGLQWDWKFEYPEYGIATTELYLPVDKAIVLKMESTDVIHSFWVPEFRVKQDLVPGRVTELHITPNRLGDYKVRCAELCGTSHYSMEENVKVVDNEKFSVWVAEQQEIAAQREATPEGRGQKIYESFCNSCHSIDGSIIVGPSWFNLFGSTVELEEGAPVTADEAFLIESIRDPKAKIVRGFASQNMPAFTFTDEEVENIVAYIKTLR